MPKVPACPQILTSLTAAREALDQAIELITAIHQLVDGREWDGQSSSDLIDLLICHGLEVRSPDDMPVYLMNPRTGSVDTEENWEAEGAALDELVEVKLASGLAVPADFNPALSSKSDWVPA